MLKNSKIDGVIVYKEESMGKFNELIRKKSRVISLGLLIVLVCLNFPMISVEAAAKINKSEITLRIGEPFRLEVSGTSKDIVWSTDSAFVAVVNEDGVVQGNNKGETTIKATVDKEDFVCKVKVIDTYDKKVTLKNISAEVSKYNKGIYVQFANKNKYPLNLTVTANFYDSKGKKVATSKQEIYYFKEQGFAAYTFIPKKAGKVVKYSSYKLSYKIEKLGDRNWGCSITPFYDEYMENGVNVGVISKGNDVSVASVTVVFVKDKKILKVETITMDSFMINEGKITGIEYPKDSKGNYMKKPEISVRLFLNYAFYYVGK